MLVGTFTVRIAVTSYLSTVNVATIMRTVKEVKTLLVATVTMRYGVRIAPTHLLFTVRIVENTMPLIITRNIM